MQYFGNTCSRFIQYRFKVRMLKNACWLMTQAIIARRSRRICERTREYNANAIKLTLSLLTSDCTTSTSAQENSPCGETSCYCLQPLEIRSKISSVKFNSRMMHMLVKGNFKLITKTYVYSQYFFSHLDVFLSNSINGSSIIFAINYNTSYLLVQGIRIKYELSVSIDYFTSKGC